MKQSIDIKKIGSAIGGFFGRYHTILFFLLLGIGLAICLIMIVQVINLSSQTNASGVQEVSQSFDQQTIDRLNELNNSTDAIERPDGRTNPFVE